MTNYTGYRQSHFTDFDVEDVYRALEQRVQHSIEWDRDHGYKAHVPYLMVSSIEVQVAENLSGELRGRKLSPGKVRRLLDQLVQQGRARGKIVRIGRQPNYTTAEAAHEEIAAEQSAREERFARMEIFDAAKGKLVRISTLVVALDPEQVIAKNGYRHVQVPVELFAGIVSAATGENL